MQIYGPSQIHGPQPINAPHGVKPAQQLNRTESPQIADEVDISDAARLVDQVHQMPETRSSRIQAVSRQIAEGTYETPEKLSIAVERLLDEIG